MKKLVFILVIFQHAFAMAIEPNETPPPKTLFKNEEWNFGGFGGPAIKISQFGSGVGTLLVAEQWLC